jgi:hypothetical protein
MYLGRIPKIHGEGQLFSFPMSLIVTILMHLRYIRSFSLHGLLIRIQAIDSLVHSSCNQWIQRGVANFLRFKMPRSLILVGRHAKSKITLHFLRWELVTPGPQVCAKKSHDLFEDLFGDLKRGDMVDRLGCEDWVYQQSSAGHSNIHPTSGDQLSSYLVFRILETITSLEMLERWRPKQPIGKDHLLVMKDWRMSSRLRLSHHIGATRHWQFVLKSVTSPNDTRVVARNGISCLMVEQQNTWHRLHIGWYKSWDIFLKKGGYDLV